MTLHNICHYVNQDVAKISSSLFLTIRTASRNVLFSSARISKALNVDRVPPPDDDSQDGAQFGSSGHDRQAFIDEFDLMISHQDVIQF